MTLTTQTSNVVRTAEISTGGIRRPRGPIRALVASVAVVAGTATGVVFAVGQPAHSGSATLSAVSPQKTVQPAVPSSRQIPGCIANGRNGVTACTGHPAAEPTLLIYGDSLTVLSEGAVNLFYDSRYTVVFRAMGGTSICDWTAGAKADLATVKPTRVVIAFTGNAASCSAPDFLHGGITAWLANYRRSLLTMRQIFAGIPISVVGSPAMITPPPNGSWYPLNGIPALDAMYRAMCARYGMTYNADADNWLTPGHRFVWQRPAFPGNGPLVTVRASDGVHVSPAGALYYGAALGA